MIARFLVWWLRRRGGEARVQVPVAGGVCETVYLVCMTYTQYRAYQDLVRRWAKYGR